MALLGDGVLLTFTEVATEDEEDFNEWYNREHLDERVAMPGFRRARRYVGDSVSPKYFASYETQKVEDLSEPAYLAVLADQSEWSKRVMARFTQFHRMTCRLTLDRTQGIGGAATVVRFFPDDDVRDTLRAWLDGEALPVAIGQPGLLGACLYENDLEVANAPARAQGVDFPTVDAVEWAVIVEGAEVGPTEAAARQALSEAALARFGIEAAVFASYRFLYGNAR
jgi:hypothetical protein